MVRSETTDQVYQRPLGTWGGVPADSKWYVVSQPIPQPPNWIQNCYRMEWMHAMHASIQLLLDLLVVDGAES
jgi:hypothetical protein